MNFLLPSLAKVSDRVRWRLARTPIAAVYAALLTEASYLTWRATRSRPRLNRDSVLQFVSAPTTADDGVIPGRLLARVPFHFRRSRLKYLVEVIEQLRLLPFKEVVIALDTNWPHAGDVIRKFCAVDEIEAHTDLESPLRLAWTHRKAMKAAFADFDYFLYIEDDMLLTPAAIRIWHERLPSLVKHGYLPGFLQVEENRKGELVASDFAQPDAHDAVRFIDGNPYLHSKFPYQAMWLYNKETMRVFLESDVFENGYPQDVQKPLENAALGYTFQQRDDGERSSRHLLPLTPSLKVDPRCYVYHMPSNYGRRITPHPAGLGTLPVDSLIHRL